MLFKAALWAFVALWLAYTAAYFKFNDAALGAFITKRVGDRRSRAVHPAPRALSVLGRARLDPHPEHAGARRRRGLHAPRSRRQSGHTRAGGLRRRAHPGAARLARQDGGDRRAPLLPHAALPARVHPVGLGADRADALDVGHGAARVQHRRRDVGAQARRVDGRRRRHPRRRGRARRHRLRHGLVGARRQADLVGQARRRPRQGAASSTRPITSSSPHDGPFFFFRLVDIKSPVAALRLGELSASRSRA